MMLALFTPKKPVMVPLWTLFVTGALSTLVAHYVGRLLKVLERWAGHGIVKARAAVRRARAAKYARVQD